MTLEEPIQKPDLLSVKTPNFGARLKYLSVNFLPHLELRTPPFFR